MNSEARRPLCWSLYLCLIILGLPLAVLLLKYVSPRLAFRQSCGQVGKKMLGELSRTSRRIFGISTFQSRSAASAVESFFLAVAA